MIGGGVERRGPVPAQLARRIGVLGVVSVVLFGVIFLRLWYLQILTGGSNAQLAAANVTRTVPIPAPRGLIVASGGQVLAENASSATVSISCSELPGGAAARQALYARLGGVLSIAAAAIAREVDCADVPAYQPIPIDADISTAALVYLAERRRLFPAVSEQPTPQRVYPYGSLAAQVLGNVRLFNTSDLGSVNYKGVSHADVVGQSGLEYEYEQDLRGVDGVERIQVNAEGTPTARAPSIAAPTQGNELRTSIDLPLEQEGIRALETALSLAHHNGYPAPAASFAAIDPRNGDVLAIGSIPAFDPNVLSRPYVSDAQYAAQTAGDALLNRAIAGAYPTGSTFKPITALAALESGLITPATLLGASAADGCVKISGQAFCNSDGADFGANDLEAALRVSEDTYFYDVGAEANSHGEVIQRVARALGLGSPTGIDLPGEAADDVPDAAWVRAENAIYHKQFCTGGHSASFCATGYYPPWTIGQNVQLATGQGYLTATPLQMAVAYAAIANGGFKVTPRIALSIQSAGGRLIRRLPAPAPRRVVPAADASYLQSILAGLHLAAQSSGGTSDDVFGSFPRIVDGKTGTAQTVTGDPTDNDSWYVAYAPDPSRPIVVAVAVEKGGYGDEAAAPAARLILAKWFGLPEKVVAGSSRSL